MGLAAAWRGLAGQGPARRGEAGQGVARLGEARQGKGFDGMQIVKTVACTHPIVVIHGTEGRGKTTLGSKFPSPLFMLLERGIPRGVTVDAIGGLDTFEDVLDALRHIFANGTPHATLVVDTLDQLEALIIKYVCKKNGWASIETPSYGKGFVEVETEVRRFISAACAIRDKHGMTIVLIAHSDIVRIEDPRAPTYTAYHLRLHKRSRALVMDVADLVGFLSDELRITTQADGFNRERVRANAGSSRYLFVEGRPAFSAKNRFGMPEKIEIGKDFDIRSLSQYWAPIEEA
jgi:AAA domain